MARDYQVLHERHALIEFLKSVLDDPHLSPTRVHQLIADLSMPFTKIITTNYDRLLERALRRVRKGFVLIVRDSDVPYFDETKIILIKIQGCITQPDSLVITEDDYQGFLAGLGNIYVDEALWASGIHPQRSAHSLDETESKALYRSIRDVLRQAIANAGTSLGNGLGNYAWLNQRRLPTAFFILHLMSLASLLVLS